jgi:hypothetical protein
MPRQARLDLPGLLQRVIVRGIERRKIFLDDEDRKAFLARLSELLVESDADCFAWALLPNHFHADLPNSADEPHPPGAAHSLAECGMCHCLAGLIPGRPRSGKTGGHPVAIPPDHRRLRLPRHPPELL